MAPKPGAFARLAESARGDAELRILRARAEEAGAGGAPRPGEIRLAESADAPPLRIGTGDGWLIPLEVQRAGGKVMDPAAFLRGNPLEAGSLLATSVEEEGNPTG
jgi:methionyl-tRNA formyltransferase